MKTINRNELLAKYLLKHKNLRVWQNIRNWAGESFIYASNLARDQIELPPEASAYLSDTFYWE
jgi:hypothetical protein